MRTSLARRNQIKVEEGFANPVSDDGFSNPTGGWGHIKGVRLGQPVTVAQGEAWLDEDIGIADDAVNKLITVPLNQGQHDVLSSFTMNEGVGALETSTLRRRLNTGDYASVRTELLRWVYADPDGAGPRPKEVVQGLINRRNREAAAWTLASAPLNPIDPAGSRTVNGAATAGAGGAADIAMQVTDAAQNAGWQLSSGNWIMIAVGVVVLAGALWAIYARLDDAGMLPWKKKPAATIAPETPASVDVPLPPEPPAQVVEAPAPEKP